MRITRLRLSDVKRHEELELRPSPRLTVVRGPNESGKSSIERAIELALYRRVTSDTAEMADVWRWGAPDGAAPTVEMDFEDEDVEGRLVKSFARGKGQARLVLNDEVITDPATVDHRLAELTGIPSEKFFRSTAAVRHQELDELDKDEGALRDRLQTSMSGADRGTSKVKRELEAAVRKYTQHGQKNPGYLKTAADDVARLRDEVEHGDVELTRLAHDQETLSAARDRRAEAERQLAEDREQLATSEHAVQLLDEQHDAEARYERFKRAATLRVSIEQKESSHPSSIALPVLREGVTRLRELERTISGLRKELSGEVDLSGIDVVIPEPRWRPFAIAAIVLAAIGLVAVALTGIAALGIVALAGLASAVVALRQRRLGSDVRRQNVLRAEQVARRLRGRSQIEQQLKDTERQRDQQLASIEQPDLPTAEALLDAEEKHVAEIEQLRAELKGLLGDPPPEEDVAVLRDRAAAETEQKRHALAGLGEIGRDPAHSRERYAAAVKAGEREREEALKAEVEAETRVSSNPVDAEKVAATAEALATAEQRLAALERRLRVLQGTLDALLQAERATMKKAARFLEQRMVHDVARITDGRYRRVEVDEKELAIRVWSPEREDWVDAHALSQGTFDQLYLAARLGLVRQVTQDRRPPLVFDDPFVTFDDERAARALEVLRVLAAEHQVLYLTTSTRYDEAADLVVELPRPTAVDTPGPAAPEAAPVA